MDRPFANGRSGHGTASRGPGGRFLPGNRAAVGRGNPHAAQVNAWRRALAETVSDDDLHAVIVKLVECAQDGQPWAVKELLDRCLGKPGPQLEAGSEIDAGPVTLRVVLDNPAPAIGQR